MRLLALLVWEAWRQSRSGELDSTTGLVKLEKDQDFHVFDIPDVTYVVQVIR